MCGKSALVTPNNSTAKGLLALGGSRPPAPFGQGFRDDSPRRKPNCPMGDAEIYCGDLGPRVVGFAMLYEKAESRKFDKTPTPMIAFLPSGSVVSFDVGDLKT